MLNNILVVLLLALVFTVVIELVVAIILGFKGNNKLKIVALASVITNPVLTLVLTMLAMFTTIYSSLYVIVFLEIIVIIVEYYILHYVYGEKETKIRLFVLSFCMNATSYVIGVLVFDQIVDFIFELV